MANYALAELYIGLIEAFGGPRPTSFGPGELYEALILAIQNFAPGGGVVTDIISGGVGISVNQPTGAVTVTNTRPMPNATAAGDILVGQGASPFVVYSLPSPAIVGTYLQVAPGPGLVWGGVNVLTTSFTSNAYTFVLTDANSHQEASNGSTAATITVPPHSSVAFPVGTVIVIRQTGSGKVSLTAAGGVTITSSVSGGFVSGTTGARAQYSNIGLINVATDSWALSGDVA